MASTKPRQPRLRASCDGCFLAKVKCSKARPLCSRCLTCGIECRYSPSSRTGKPKSDGGSSIQISTPTELSSMSPPLPAEELLMFSSQQAMSGPPYKQEEGGWNSPPPRSVDDGMTRSYSLPSLNMMGVDVAGAGQADPVVSANMHSSGMPWTPPIDPPAQLLESSNIGAFLSRRSHSYDFGVQAAAPMPSWTEPNALDMYMYGPTQFNPDNVPANYYPSPATTRQVRSTPRLNSSSTGTVNSGGSCTCFIACLQSLYALHNASSPTIPAFDTVLSLNRKAVEGCASMLACARCMSRSGTHTAVMLLATVIGKITSFYKNASHIYFENGYVASPASPNSLGVSFGAYTLPGEEGRWIELEILARELRKLEEVYDQFRDMCADHSEDPEVSRAMIGYIGHNLGSTLEVIQNRKEISYG